MMPVAVSVLWCLWKYLFVREVIIWDYINQSELTFYEKWKGLRGPSCPYGGSLFTWASFHITTLSTENVPQRNSPSTRVTRNRLQGTHYWFSHQLCRWPCKVKVHCLVCKDTWLKCWKNWKRPWLFFTTFPQHNHVFSCQAALQVRAATSRSFWGVCVANILDCFPQVGVVVI